MKIIVTILMATAIALIISCAKPQQSSSPVTPCLGTPSTSSPTPGVTQMPTPEPTPLMENYTVKIDFTYPAYDEITWEAGLIELADGRNQNIDAGSMTLTETHYAYFIWGESTLQWTLWLCETAGGDRGLVTVASIGTP